MESKVIEKKEIQLGDRKIEVRLVECNVNQHNAYQGQRIYSRFLDNPKEKVAIDENKKISIGKKILSDEQVKMLKKVIKEIPDEEI